MRACATLALATLAIAALTACASNPGARETLVLDDFDSPVMELQLSHSTDRWGDVLVDAGAEIALVPGLGLDGSPAALVEFRSEVATGDARVRLRRQGNAGSRLRFR